MMVLCFVFCEVDVLQHVSGMQDRQRSMMGKG